jgi:hypothetical protein
VNTSANHTIFISHYNRSSISASTVHCPLSTVSNERRGWCKHLFSCYGSGTVDDGSNQCSLQSDRGTLIDLDCEIIVWLIRIELTISREDRLNNQPVTVLTNNNQQNTTNKMQLYLVQ